MTLQSGQPTTLDLVLAPAAQLVVTLVDANGEPVPIEEGIELSALATDGQSELSSGFVGGGGSVITIRGLPGSPILLKVLGEEIWFDRATSKDTATPINLTAGETTEINFTLLSG